MRIKYFTMLQNMPIFQFSRRCYGPYGLGNNYGPLSLFELNVQHISCILDLPQLKIAAVHYSSVEILQT